MLAQGVYSFDLAAARDVALALLPPLLQHHEDHRDDHHYKANAGDDAWRFDYRRDANDNEHDARHGHPKLTSHRLSVDGLRLPKPPKQAQRYSRWWIAGLLPALLPKVDQAEHNENKDNGHHDSEQTIDRDDHAENLASPALLG